jgi:hypothetical protein
MQSCGGLVLHMDGNRDPVGCRYAGNRFGATICVARRMFSPTSACSCRAMAHSYSSPDPAIKRKKSQLKMVGIPLIIGCFVLALISFMGHLPIGIFWFGLCAEALLGPYFLIKIHSLKNSQPSISDDQRKRRNAEG